MDITVIIPAYNRLWSLPQAVNSCRNNRCTVEIIVVDDGSTDGTWEWLQQQKDIIILKQPNQGKCWAVNKAFELAKGKYVRFLDSDDRVNLKANDEEFDIAEANGSDIVVSGYLLIDEDGKTIRQQPWTECDDFIAQNLGECDSSHYSAFLFKRSFIADIPHRPDYAYRDDRLFALEAAIKMPKVVVHKGLALMHTQHKRERLQVNIGLQQSVQNFQHLNIYKKILGLLQQKGKLTQRRVRASENILWPLCHWIAKTNLNDANDLLKWIKTIDPEFKIPENGVLGFMYNNFGFKKTEQLLKMRRLLKFD